MNVKIISRPITKAEALEIAKEFYGDMVKGVVDIEKGIIALGGEYHIDANMVLIKAGSTQKNLWGFNLYPKLTDSDWIEYTSLINIRPTAHNRSIVIEDQKLRDIMEAIIAKLVI